MPDDVSSITIEVVGAGGSGGFNGSGGGGGGGYAVGNYEVEPQQEIEITIGVPGQGSGPGTSSAGALISASGGENGTSVSNPNIGGGGAGGMGSGGTIANYKGGDGGGGYYTYFGGGGGGAAGPLGNGGDGGNTIVWDGSNCNTPGGDAGVSGGDPGGGGGKGAGFTDNFCNVTNPAGVAGKYGGAGGGGNGNGGAPTDGVSGYCRITWCTLDLSVTVQDNYLIANATGVSYQWVNCDSNYSIIAEQTLQEFHPTETGSYAVIISDGICSDTSECFTLVFTGVSGSMNERLVYCENPFTDYIYLHNTTDDETFELLSNIGQQLWSGNNLLNKNFSYLPSGLYYLRVFDEETSVMVRLVKR